MMKKSILGIYALLGLHSVSAFAVMGPVVAVRGVVENFDAEKVELSLRNGTRLEVPRSAFAANQDLRPGQKVIATAPLEEIKATRAANPPIKAAATNYRD